MISTDDMEAAVRAAWSRIPAPPADDVKFLSWSCGEESWRAFAGIAPMDVDISSPGFYACTPLLDLPPRAAAAYFGTYVLSLLRSLRLQEGTGLFGDLLTRAHVIHCLTNAEFWRSVIRAHLPPECRQTLVQFAAYLAPRRELIALSEKEIELVAALAAEVTSS